MQRNQQGDGEGHNQGGEEEHNPEVADSTQEVVEVQNTLHSSLDLDVVAAPRLPSWPPQGPRGTA